jgi:hypothetical protein
MRLPFSMKGLRDAHTRVVASRAGWLARRKSSSPVFPFRRNEPESPPAPKDLTGMWGCAILIVIWLAIIAAIVFSLGR